MSDRDDTPKKDLTGLHHTMSSQKMDQTKEHPKENDLLKPIEQIDDFASLDQLGMMDHPVDPVADAKATQATTPAVHASEQVDSNAAFEFSASVPASSDFPISTETSNSEVNIDFAEDSAPTSGMDFGSIHSDGKTEAMDSAMDSNNFAVSDPTFLTEVTALQAEEPAPSKNSNASLNTIRDYAENAQSFSDTLPISFPFHLHIRGRFGPFERDKLLLFVTENSIGMTAADLDLQIQAGRVFFSRISEYAGIRLIQDLRDSGLELNLKPSDRDAEDRSESSPILHYQYTATGAESAAIGGIPILPANAASLAFYDAFDSIQGNQFLKAEMVEAEKSELFQEVVERMVESIRHKAKLKGADALTHFQQTITPLRLASQYQISVEATMLRKKS